MVFFSSCTMELFGTYLLSSLQLFCNFSLNIKVCVIYIYCCFIECFWSIFFSYKQELLYFSIFSYATKKNLKDGKHTNLDRHDGICLEYVGGWGVFLVHFRCIANQRLKAITKVHDYGLGSSFQMFRPMNVDFVKKLKIYELMLWIIHILWQQPKEKPTLHTTLKQNKTNLVQDIKGGRSPRPIFKKENTFRECLIVWGNILQATNLDVWLLWKEVIMSLEQTFCNKKLKEKMIDKA